MVSETKHTPLPWFVVEREATQWTGRPTFDISSGTEESGYQTVVGNEGLWDNEETDGSNARLIVQAVNCYSLLLAALKQVISKYPDRECIDALMPDSGWGYRKYAGDVMSDMEIAGVLDIIAEVEREA